MRRTLPLIAVISLFAAWVEPAGADEVWTYKFIVNGSRPYRADCDCSNAEYADIGGSFSILLNWQTLTGRILELDDHLTNLASGTYTPGSGVVMTPLNLPEQDYGIIPPWQADGPIPDGHFTYANSSGHLVSNGNQPLFPPITYDVAFSRTGATLNMTAGGIDAGILVTNATAVFSKAAIVGDYNSDGRVDASDYVLLRNTDASPHDFQLWQTYFGSSSAPVSGAAVPESSTALLLVVMCACGVVFGRTRLGFSAREY